MLLKASALIVVTVFGIVTHWKRSRQPNVSSSRNFTLSGIVTQPLEDIALPSFIEISLWT